VGLLNPGVVGVAAIIAYIKLALDDETVMIELEEFENNRGLL